MQNRRMLHTAMYSDNTFIYLKKWIKIWKVLRLSNTYIFVCDTYLYTLTK